MPKKLTYEEVKEYIESYGCELLSEEYINNRIKLKIKCGCGNIFETTFNHFRDRQQRQCQKCGIKTRTSKYRLSYEEVKEYIESFGCELLSEEYINNRIKLKIKCSCGNVFEKSFNHFRDREKQCKKCYFKSVSGENNYMYNPNLTDEEREKGRFDIQNKKWRKQVYERDNYICQCCGKKGGNLNAHHLNGYNWDKLNRYNIDNGVTLCKECHKDFHDKYGFGDNTKEQFIEYIKNKNN